MALCAKCGAEYSGGAHACRQAGIPTLLVEWDQEPDFDSDKETSLYDAGAIIGQYRLVQLIGEGAVGRVYLAEHTALGRKVALKMVRSELAKNRSIMERFFGEARAVNQIRHENIVEITDFVREDPHGRSYYIMELLDGYTLRALLEEVKVVPLPRALSIAVQICGGLAAVHEKGIVHRDLKPENVFLSQKTPGTDFVKLLDFGAAKLSNLGDEQLRHQTQNGMLVGTPAYMSPEQTFGATVDHRADIYGLGLLLYEMVTGRPAFEGDNLHQVLLAQRNEMPPSPRSMDDLPEAIPERLDALIMGCLAKKPDHRPRNMIGVRRELELMLEKRSRTRLPAIAALGTLAIAATTTLFLVMGPEQETPVIAMPVPPSPPTVPAPLPPPPPELAPTPREEPPPVAKKSKRTKKKSSKRTRSRASKKAIGLGDMRDPFNGE